LASAAAAFIFLLRRERRAGETFGLALVLAALARFFIDELRPDYVLPETMAGFLRLDQVVLIALTAGGMCFFFQRGARHAQ
jgi:phosphatidylglycerol:prolipoprotein diacylglycerol transferase